jgi:hypothetical protein
MLTAIREVQLPLLAAVLLGACAAKAWKALRAHAEGGHSDPSALFPAHLRRPIMTLVFAASSASASAWSAPPCACPAPDSPTRG